MLQNLFGYKTRPAVSFREAAASIKTITPTDLHQQLSGSNAPLLIDVRTPAEYKQDGHIAGSRLLPLSALTQRSQELPSDRPIVCVCRSGSRSQTACEQLASRGFSDVTNLAGGMIDWHRAGLPSQ